VGKKKKENKIQKNVSRQKQDHKSRPTSTDLSKLANAPYNFVPLNRSIVKADPLPKHDKYYNENSDRITGYIDCTIRTETPVFIGSSITIDEFGKQKESADNKFKKSDFFSPAGEKAKHLHIPGSSLRGMVRNLVEIVSWSRFGFFEDKNLYYRSFAEANSLGIEYNKNINPVDNESNKPSHKISAGYIVKKGVKYCIYPAMEKQYEKIITDDARELIKNSGEKYSKFNYYEVDNGKYIVVSGPMPAKKDWIINKIDKDPEKEIEIPEIDIESYRNDVTRGEKVYNLLDKCEDDPIVPCFYFTWTDKNENKRVSFGHTGLFRIAYEKSIGYHLPAIHREHLKYLFTWDNISKEDEDKIRTFLEDELEIGWAKTAKISKSDNMIIISTNENSAEIIIDKNENISKLIINNEIIYRFTVKKENGKLSIYSDKLDFAHAIFGANTEETENLFAGRVSFEDAYLVNPDKNPVMKESSVTLLEPKPTSFQLYLEQDTNDLEKLKHYNSETQIRGNKFYWHKSKDNWDKNKSGKNDKVITKIKPVEPKTLFKFRIRYENLSKNELGALLFVLKLPDGCAHKIGMGKPLGLGSVFIKPTLFKTDRGNRYLSLFNDKDKEYFFSWNEIPGNDDERIIEYLKDELKIEWVKTENIGKIDDGKTIIVSNKEKSISLKLNDEKTKVNLKIDDDRVDEFTVKIENGKLNIYHEDKWELCETQCGKEEMDKIIGVFEQHILKNMSEKDRKNAAFLWETNRLMQLKLILDVNHGKELEKSGKTNYMEFPDGFKNRNVLPTAENV